MHFSRHLFKMLTLFFAATTLVPWVEAETTPSQITVLCYHRFGDHYASHDPYAVTVAEFTRQLEIIQEEGFTPMTASQMAEGVAGKVSLPAKPLVITVDDGYKDFVRVAQPLLQAHHYPATLFVYSNFINSKNGLTAEQLKELQQAGFEIGSHTASHPYLTRYPSRMTETQKQRELHTELITSRQKLQAWSGGTVSVLAYPYGLWDNEVAKVVQTVGYQASFTVNPGPNALTQPSHCFNRIMILRGTREKTFRAMLRDQAIEITAWKPGLGERVQGPLSEIAFTLAPSTLGRLKPASLTLMCGSQSLDLKTNPTSGEVVAKFKQPLTKGTQLLILTARDGKGQNTFKTSWLIIVDPAVNGKQP